MIEFFSDIKKVQSRIQMKKISLQPGFYFQMQRIQVIRQWERCS